MLYDRLDSSDSTILVSKFNLNPAYIKLLILSSNISSQESSDDRSAITQEFSDSGAEIENLHQIQGKSKPTDQAFRSWKFTDTIQADDLDSNFWKVNSKKGNGS